MKLTVIISQSNPEQVHTAFRLAIYSRKNGDNTTVFLSAEGVDAFEIQHPLFDVMSLMETFVADGGVILTCGTCMNIRDKDPHPISPISSMQELYGLIATSDRTVTF